MSATSALGGGGGKHSGGLDHPQVHHEFKTILGCTRSCFKKRKSIKQEGLGVES